MATSMKRFGGTVRQIRSKRGITQAEAAAKAEVSASYWALIEQGKRSPNLTVLENIAGALGVPASILVFLASDMTEFERVDKSVAESMALLSWKLLEADGLSNGDSD